MDNDKLNYYYRQIEIACSKYNKTLFKLDELNYHILTTNNLVNSLEEILDYRNKLENKLTYLQNTIYFMSRNAHNHIINNHEWNMWTSRTII